MPAPGCWVFLVLLVLSVGLGVKVSAWFFTGTAALVAFFAFLRSLVHNDCGT